MEDGGHISGYHHVSRMASQPTSQSGHSLSKGGAPLSKSPHPSPSSLQLSHRKGPSPPFTDRRWLPRAFLRGLHIDSADAEFQVQPGPPPPPFQEAVPNCAIVLGTLALLREAERKEARERKGEGGERSQHLPDSMTLLTRPPCPSGERASSEPDRLGFKAQLQPSLAV